MRAPESPAGALQGPVETHCGQHLSQPGNGAVLSAPGARFGDAPGRYADAKARKNYTGTAPITRQSGKSVHARLIHNDRLVDALHIQASEALLHDPGFRAY